MRVDVVKRLFVGHQGSLEAFYLRAQKMGIVQFVVHGKGKEPLDGELSSLVEAIQELRKHPRSPQVRGKRVDEAVTIAERVLSARDRYQLLAEELAEIRRSIAASCHFGDFSRDDLRYLERSGLVVQFFCAPRSERERLAPIPTLIFLTEASGVDHYLSLASCKTSYPKMMEVIIEMPLGELKRREVEVLAAMRSFSLALSRLASYNDFLHEALDSYLDRHDFDCAKKTAHPLLNDHLFFAEGWIRSFDQPALQTLAEELSIVTMAVAPKKDEVIPTHLENHKLDRVGEDLVEIYDTPSNTDNDPSRWVLAFFILFFSIIVGDAAYGLVLLLLSLYLSRRLNHLRGGWKRALSLGVVLGSSCLIWGILIHSFLGLKLSPDHPLRGISLLDRAVHHKAAYHLEEKDATWQAIVKKYPESAKAATAEQFLRQAKEIREGKVVYPPLENFADQILLELALVIGIIHIILSLLRYANRNYASFGWALLVLGSYLYIPSYIKADSAMQYLFYFPRDKVAAVGWEMIVWGGIGACIIALIQHRFSGLKEPMQVISLFADVLSYLRIYALSLAGAMVSGTANEMASMLPWIPAILLLFCGHSINFGLSMMGGTIHGLRLNFLEWYHYCFEGGGKRFSPLKARTDLFLVENRLQRVQVKN